MPAYLDEILARHRARAAADQRPIAELVRAAEALDPPRPFEGCLRNGSLRLIAELKRRSPSKGDLAPGVEAGQVGRDYAEGGASCLSVLTDAAFFGGSPEDLDAARTASGLPVLRKDFTIGVRDVLDARLMEADAVLLIAAALGHTELASCATAAADLGMAALIETHDESEVERAVASGASLIGVNQRDLRTFEVDRARAARMATLIPNDCVAVAESGIGGPEDVPALVAAGFSAMLVGESLVCSGDRAAATRALVAAGSDQDS